MASLDSILVSKKKFQLEYVFYYRLYRCIYDILYYSSSVVCYSVGKYVLFDEFLFLFLMASSTSNTFENSVILSQWRKIYFLDAIRYTFIDNYLYNNHMEQFAFIFASNKIPEIRASDIRVKQIRKTIRAKKESHARVLAISGNHAYSECIFYTLYNFIF